MHVAAQFGVTGTLYGSWCRWARDAGETPGTAKAFSQKLQARGFRSGRQGGAGDRGFHGLEIRQSVFVPPAPEMRVGGEGGA